MELSHDTLKEILVLPGHVSDEDLQIAVTSAQQRGVPPQEVIVDSGLISDEYFGRAVADFYDAHFIDLKDTIIKDEYLTMIPEIVARSQRAIVVDSTDTEIHVATEQLDNFEFFSLLKKKLSKEVRVFYTTTRMLDRALKSYKGDLKDKIEELITTSAREQHDGDIVDLVDHLMEYASDSRASDIHIEPLEEDVHIRFRIDGLLHEAVRYPTALHEKVVFRIKILAHMQTDEHAAAQDGRFEYKGADNIFDVRVSILPITNGENVVMRLLDSQTHRYTLENLGLSDKDYATITRSIAKPHGMILAVGPTGSGKTTVLYTILEKLNNEEVNVMTIEDPVEYHLEGIQQTQVNPKKNLTFATGLRSIVRQDPDIIMVGEIRDEETADISVNSALTGHLVISTLHTNDAATTFPRLMEMNVEPFLIASSVNVIVALRLVRKICAYCKESYIPAEAEVALLELDPTITKLIKELSGKDDLASLRLYRGAGCKACRNSGYNERIGIFEVLEVNEHIRLLITKRASADVLNAEALTAGMTSLLYDGIDKALKGITTLEEVIKVARS